MFSYTRYKYLLRDVKVFGLVFTPSRHK